ncbi:MAG: hypothetical protein IPL61_16060 [Myxococcales bacterium]|nr:hypothetical protein [Myxococcales bacterium]
MRLVAAALAALAALAVPARAQPVTYQSHGSAAAGEADARTRALDAAFATAVTEAVADLAGKAARAQAAAVDREIVKRARRFVASFAVTDERTRADRLEIDVDVRIDHDKVRTRLLELGVELRGAPPPEPSTPAILTRPATVLYRVVGAGEVAASFGAAARSDLPGAAALEAALARAGYRAVPASAAGPPPDDGGKLPVDDQSARALAVDVHADVALVVGVAVGAPGAIRGTPLEAAPARAWLRLIEAGTGRVTLEAATATAVWRPAAGGDRADLTERAVTQAVGQLAVRGFGAATPRPTSIEAGPPLVATAGVTVRVVGAGAWQAAALIRADLAAAPGVTATNVAGVAGDTVALAVAGIGVDKAASIARATPGFSARTRVDGGAVVVQIKALATP